MAHRTMEGLYMKKWIASAAAVCLAAGVLAGCGSAEKKAEALYMSAEASYA